MTGTTLHTVSRILSAFESQGLVEEDPSGSCCANRSGSSGLPTAATTTGHARQACDYPHLGHLPRAATGTIRMSRSTWSCDFFVRADPTSGSLIRILFVLGQSRDLPPRLSCVLERTMPVR